MLKAQSSWSWRWQRIRWGHGTLTKSLWICANSSQAASTRSSWGSRMSHKAFQASSEASTALSATPSRVGKAQSWSNTQLSACRTLLVLCDQMKACLWIDWPASSCSLPTARKSVRNSFRSISAIGASPGKWRKIRHWKKFVPFWWKPMTFWPTSWSWSGHRLARRTWSYLWSTICLFSNKWLVPIRLWHGSWLASSTTCSALSHPPWSPRGSWQGMCSSASSCRVSASGSSQQWPCSRKGQRSNLISLSSWSKKFAPSITRTW